MHRGRYQLAEKIHEGRRCTVYRGRDDETGGPAIFKLPHQEASPAEIARLRHEYEMLRRLDCPEAIKAYALHQDRRGTMLVLEDFRGLPLRQLQQPGLPLWPGC